MPVTAGHTGLHHELITAESLLPIRKCSRLRHTRDQRFVTVGRRCAHQAAHWHAEPRPVMLGHVDDRTGSPAALAAALRIHRLPRRRRPGDRGVPRPEDAPSAVLRGRAGHRQDRARAGARHRAGRRADPAAVLRGHRRLAGPLRLGLPAPAAAPARPGGHGRAPGARTTSRPLSTTGGSCWPGRSCGPCSRRAPCCSSTRSTGRTTSSRRSCSRCSPSTPCRSPSWARCARTSRRSSCSPRNRTREVHDALKRRCLYLWLDHPDVAREIEILHARIPGLPERLAAEVAAAAHRAARGGPAQASRCRGVARLGAGPAARRRPPPRHRQRGGHARRRPQVPGGRRPRAGPARHAARLLTDARSTGARSTGAQPRPGPRARRVHRRAAPRRPAGHHRPGHGVPDRRRRPGRTGASRSTAPGVHTLCADPDDLPRYERAFVDWFDADPRRPPDRAAAPADPAPVVAAALRDDGRRRRRRRRRSAGAGERLGRRGAAPPRPRRAVADRARAPAGRCSRCCVPTRRRGRRAAGPPPGAVPPTRGAPCARRCAPTASCACCARRDRSRRPRKVVLLIDVSGSMEPYADALLRFAHVVVRRAPASTEVFTLGTRLTRVTRELRLRDPEHALAAAGRSHPGLVGRHPAGRGAGGLRRPLGTARGGPAGRRRGLLRRLGARRHRRCWAPSSRGCAGWRTGWSG